MKSIWTATYGDHRITIENTWFNGERLLVNGFVQDDKSSLFSSVLTGHVINAKGERENIKANLGGFISVNCKLFINDQMIELLKEK